MKNLFQFLSDLRHNNNREWFIANKHRYLEAKATADSFTENLIEIIGNFDSRTRLLSPKDCTYRIYRDVRFSADKTPYKTHIGIFINPPYGKKCNTCGYYVHLEPGNSIVCGGTIGLESKVIKAIRQSIYDEIDEYRSIVESSEFRTHFSELGMNMLKTTPKGFSKDWEYIDYLRPKDFCCSQALPDKFFFSGDVAVKLEPYLRQAKRFNDFINYTIENYLSIEESPV